MRSHWDGMVQPCHFGLGEVDRYAGGAKEIAAQDEIVVDRCGRVEDMRGVAGNVQGATEFGQYQVGEFDGGSCLEVAAVVAKLYLACVSSVGPRGKALRLIMVCEPPESSRTTKGRKRDWPPIVLTATRVDGTKSLVRVESSALSVEAGFGAAEALTLPSSASLRSLWASNRKASVAQTVSGSAMGVAVGSNMCCSCCSIGEVNLTLRFGVCVWLSELPSLLRSVEVRGL